MPYVLYIKVPAETRGMRKKTEAVNGVIVTKAVQDRDTYQLLKTLRNEVQKVLKTYCDYDDLLKGWVIRNVANMDQLVEELLKIFEKYESLGFKPGKDIHFTIAKVDVVMTYP